jgi:hypothetical protein
MNTETKFTKWIKKHKLLFLLILGMFIGGALIEAWSLGSHTIKCQAQGNVYIPSVGCFNSDKLPLCKDNYGKINIAPPQPIFNLSMGDLA